MNDIILLKQGEIVLKGLNRRIFEDRLVSNLRRSIAAAGNFRVYALQSTVYAEPQDDGCDMDAALEICRKTFGAVAVSRAAACEKNADAIFETAKEYLAEDFAKVSSFKVESKRSDKSFPMTSVKLSQYVGGLLAEAFPNVRPDMHNPELTVNLEVRDRAAYVHGSPIPGAGGMPVGSNGRVVSLLSGGIDSPVSTYMAAKRGVEIVPVHFFSFPYTSEMAKEKVLTLAKIISSYCGRMTMQIVPFTHIQEEIRDKCPEEYFTIVMRRFMMRIADRIANNTGCAAIVTGESLGQVASQTMQAMGVTEACATLPVLRPLVCLDKSEIVKIARQIDTFDTSILPYEDCCTVFTPRHPRTKPRLPDVEQVETALDIDALVEDALNNIERIKIS